VSDFLMICLKRDWKLSNDVCKYIDRNMIYCSLTLGGILFGVALWVALCRSPDTIHYNYNDVVLFMSCQNKATFVSCALAFLRS